MIRKTRPTPVLAGTKIERDAQGYPTVWAVWQGVDRPIVHGIGCSNDRVARRLEAAIMAGVVFLDPVVKVDNYGKTYVDARCTVMGRRANSDLKQLGY